MALGCFVIMPFRREYDAVFAAICDAARSAVPGEQIECRWLKDVHAAGRITDDILDSLGKATLCIADVSESNPNVMWETGYAMALGRPTILLARDVANLPFDLKVHRVLGYSLTNLAAIKPVLAEALRQTLAKCELPAAARSGAPPAARASIAVTGSMRADPAAASRRIETLLTPYLGSDSVWYCGSAGTVDECAIEFLAARGERVWAVGYDRFDCSERVRHLVAEKKAAFLDASVESLPKGITGPHIRDLFFCVKSDLVILFWDSRSQGTGQLVRYFEDSGKNLLIGFV